MLDLFCGVGGAAMGYHLSGFDVVGVDLKPQKNYPFPFIQGDALEVLAKIHHQFDIFHASPPCQYYSKATNISSKNEHWDSIPPTRAALEKTGKPFVMENVPGSSLRPDIELYGPWFGLGVLRKRIFELGGGIFLLNTGGMPKRGTVYDGDYVTVAGKGSSYFSRKGCNVDQGEKRKAKFWKGSIRDTWGYAMGIDWATNRLEIAQAIPPAYTEWIGKALLESGQIKTRNPKSKGVLALARETGLDKSTVSRNYKLVSTYAGSDWVDREALALRLGVSYRTVRRLIQRIELSGGPDLVGIRHIPYNLIIENFPQYESKAETNR